MGIEDDERHLDKGNILAELGNQNPKISPDGLARLEGLLGEMFAGYRKFVPMNEGGVLWARPDTIGWLNEVRGELDRVLVFFCGPPGAGKDFMAQGFAEIGDWAGKIVTTTSKPPERPDDVEGWTYYFLGSMDHFMAMAEPAEGVEVLIENQFLEHVVHFDEEGNPYRAYGMQVGALLAVLESGKRVMFAMTDVFKQEELVARIREMVPGMEDLEFLSLFVGPAMDWKSYSEMLERIRPDDAELRMEVALREIEAVPGRERIVWVNNLRMDDPKVWKEGVLEPVVKLVMSLLRT